MSVTITLLILVLLLLLSLSAFFSGTETAFFSLSGVQIARLEEENRPNAPLVRALLRRSDLLLNGVLLGNLIVNVLLTATATILSCLLLTPRGFSEGAIFVMDIFGVSFLLLVLGEVTPKLLAIRHPGRIAVRVSPVIRSWLFLWSPVLNAMAAVSNLFRRLFRSRGPGPRHTSDELKSLFDISVAGGDLETGTHDMISSVFDLGDTKVKEIMVPRIDVVGIDLESNVGGLLALVRESEYSRIPVYRESIDRVEGIVYAKDLLAHVFREGTLDDEIRPLVKYAYFVPESKPIDDLLKELQRERVHMAVVVDEYGGTAGLVTMEDIIEEIVGEIQDEYDVEEQAYRRLDENAWLVDGRLDIDDLSDLVGTEIEGEGFETVGGLIYQALGRIPHQGEEVVVHDIRFIVSKVVRRRIKRVKVIRGQADAEAATDA